MKKGDLIIIAVVVILLLVWTFAESGGSTVEINVNGSLYKELVVTNQCYGYINQEKFLGRKLPRIY